MRVRAFSLSLSHTLSFSLALCVYICVCVCVCIGMILQSVQTEQDALSRFLTVCKWYLAGWHFKPPGVKKPYNPILGEVFQCRFDWGAAGNTLFAAEQVT